MFQIPAPNYTQTPNALFDEWLPKLGMAELKVLMVIMRKTFGWHKVRDQISLSQLEEITGLERRHVLKGVKGLVEKNLITKVVEGKNGAQKTYYELVITDDSNNSYQCPNDTPTSVLKTPTKETPTKQINTNVNVPKRTERNVCINESLKKIGGLDDKAKEYASLFATEHEIQDTLEACRYQEKKRKIPNPSAYFLGTLKNKMKGRRSA
jgi:phage replication O-like protein O